MNKPEEMNQSIKADASKLRPTLVPPEAIWAIAAAREHGVRKYGSADYWKDVEPARYRDALYRHLLAELADVGGIDAQSGLPHTWHIACNAAFLVALSFNDGHGLQEDGLK